MKKKARVLPARYGKASGGTLTREDRIDIEIGEARLREIDAHPERLISTEEVERQLGIR